jgi:hypothetical protein
MNSFEWTFSGSAEAVTALMIVLIILAAVVA